MSININVDLKDFSSDNIVINVIIKDGSQRDCDVVCEGEPIWRHEGYQSESDWLAVKEQEAVEMAVMVDALAIPGVDNTELEAEAFKWQQKMAVDKIAIYGSGTISRGMLVNPGGQLTHQLDVILAEAYQETKQYFVGDNRFRINDDSGELIGEDGTLFVRSLTGTNKADYEALFQSDDDSESRVFGEDDESEKSLRYEVTDAFVKYLVSLDSWKDLGCTRFDTEVKRQYNLKMAI